MSALSKFMTKTAARGALIAILATPALAADDGVVKYRYIEGKQNGVISGIVTSPGEIRVKTPSKGISGWICAVNYFRKDSDISSSEAKRAAQATIPIYQAINDKWVRRNAGKSRPNYSGRSKEEFTRMSELLASMLPNDLSQTMYRGNNPGNNASGRLSSTSCFAFAVANANGRPYSVYPIAGSQQGKVTPNHHERGVYTDFPVGTPKPFRIQKFEFVQP